MPPTLFPAGPATPLAVSLRPYQQAAVDALYGWFATHTGNPLVVLPTGSGKSICIAAFIHSVLSQWPRERILMLTHVRELIQQNNDALLRAWPAAPVGIYSAGIGRREHDAPVLCAGIQSVYEKAAKIGWADLVLVDECFVAGTPIGTLRGPVAIEDLRVGDSVLNATGVGIVEAVSESLRDVIDLELSDGKSLRCTANHPFFTGRGWVEAGSLGVGEILVGHEALLALWRSVPPVAEGAAERGTSCAEGEHVGASTLLLDLLLEEAREPDERQPSAHPDARDAAEDQAQADPAWWQWASAAAAATRTAARARGRLGVGGGGADRRQGTRAPNELQDRHRQPDGDAGDRTGRGLARGDGSQGAGRTQAGVPGVVRVARVSRPERRGPQAVFNLRVGGHPSYFAGGVLVHNCHLVPAKGMGMYRTLLNDLRSMNPKMKVIGFTATPFRTDSGSLDKGDDRLFHGVAYDCDLVALIKDGFLSPVTAKATRAAIDTSAVHVRGGEFIEGELQAAAMAGDTVQRAVAEIVARGGDRRAWLVFCCGIKHAHAVADAMRSHGISTAMVFGETHTEARDAAIASFKAGSIRALVNVGVLTTGFDAPQTDLVVLLRPTMSPGLYVQMVGRGLRLAPGKKDALVLDFGGNVMRHGPIDCVRVKEPGTKEGSGTVPARECPNCQTLVGIAVRQCPECGFEWVVAAETSSKHDDKPAEQDLIAGLAGRNPIERWDVRFQAARRHQKDGRAPTLCMEYEAGFQQRVREWICFEHPEGSFPRLKAHQWWAARGGRLPAPESVDLAIVRIEAGELRRVTGVTVDTRGEWPELRGVRLEEEPGAVDFAEPVRAPAESAASADYGDIPF